MQRLLAILATLLAGGVVWAGGTISGTVEPVARCRAIHAINRAKVIRDKKKIDKKAKKGFPAKIDRQTGKFTIANLPDGTYDLAVDATIGRIEGFDCSLTLLDYDEAALTEKHRKKILDIFRKMPPAFMDKHVPLHIEGNGKHVRVLVMKIRDRDFHSGKGEAIIRFEIWPFDNFYGTWQHRPRSNFVLVRERMKADAYRKFCRTFDRSIGGIRIKKGKKIEGVEIRIPEKPNAKMGKVPF